jgi:outer membrane protein TolC
LAEKVLDTRILAEEDSKNTRDISAERFKTGEIKLEDMTKASESYYQALENRMTAETDLEIAKIDLEQLLGIQWSFAVKMRQRIKNR